MSEEVELRAELHPRFSAFTSGGLTKSGGQNFCFLSVHGRWGGVLIVSLWVAFGHETKNPGYRELYNS